MRLPRTSHRKGSDRLVDRVLALAALIACSAPAWTQQPLFTFVQTCDSQPQSSSEWQRFEDVLEEIATGGQSGSLLPRKPAFVLFAGDLTWGGQDAEFIQWKGSTDAWLTANGIALLCAPGNHDVDGGDIVNYEQHIATAGVWDVGSTAFTGHNGISVTTGWEGLRFIGFNNSNPTWNRISAADLTLQEKKIVGSYMGSNRFRFDMPKYVDFYLDGRLKLDEMISARIALEQVNGAFDRMRNGEAARQVIVFG